MRQLDRQCLATEEEIRGVWLDRSITQGSERCLGSPKVDKSPYNQQKVVFSAV